MVRNPPDILITTPESLFLLLTSQARETLRGIETVIVDEVHAVAGTKRGAHLALSLERLDRLTGKPIQRVGLSATQRPLEEIGRFVSGGREIELVDAGGAKELDLKVVVPLDDMREPEEQQSIWPSIYPEILELVRAHRSTIVFVNNRRLAERLALRLNDLAEEEIARAHHGSLAREQRVEVEELLKKGEIPCLVATSSLELGIDMGAVDLVIQVESPKSVARGLQRVGRAGHELGAVSKGRIFPKFRADLLESAVVVKRMLEGGDRGDEDPAQPARRARPADRGDLRRRGDRGRRAARAGARRLPVRRPLARPARERARHARRALPVGRVRRAARARRLGSHGRRRQGPPGRAGGSPSRTPERFPTAGSSASTSSTAAGGSASSTRRWSTRRGPARRSCSAPAPGGSRRSPATACSSRRRPGVPGAVPFWKGEGVGRPYELGRGDRRHLARAGRAVRRARRRERLQSEHKLDERAAPNLLTFLREQEAATGAVPSDRTIVVERFRDEIGDWRLCILTPFGGRVHAPWALALGARLRESLGLETQAIWSDDGIAIHLPDADAPPPIDEVLLEPEQIEELVTQELGDTALFGARFRENAGRSLLIPRRRPGERTPLWQQRLKAQSLLQVARRYPAFPVVLETYRECLQDVFDLPALKRLLQGLRTRQIDLVDVETASASPYAASLLFDYVANYMYEDDTPAAERRAQALSLDRDLLRELLGQEELRDLIDPGALEEVETRLRGEAADARRAARPAPPPRRPARGRVPRGPGRAAAGRAPRRARPRRGRAAPDRGRGRGPLPRRASARCRRAACPRSSSRPTRSRCTRSCAASRARAGRSRPARRTSASAATSSPCCGSSSAATSWSAASCGPGEPSASGATRRSCGGSGAPRWPRCAARSSRPSRPRSGASCRAGTASAAARRCARRSCRCRGWRCRSRSGSRTCCLAACPAIGPSSSTRSAPRARWSGSARASTASRSTSARTRPRSGRRRRPTGPRRRSTSGSARRSAAARSSGTTSCSTSGSRPRRRCPRSGISSGPARSRTTPGRRCAPLVATQTQAQQTARPRRFSRSRAGEVTATQGRWSLTATLFPGRPDRRALAELLLERQGIVTRDGVRGEGIPGGYGAVYGELKALETLGLCRRGYFVEGLGGRAVRARRGGRAAARAATEGRRGGRAARARGGRPGAAVRRRAAVAEARGGAGRAGRRRPRRPARRRAGALRRARRPLARAAARARGGMAARRPGGAGRARASGGRRSGSRWSASTASRWARPRSFRC